MHTYSCNFKTRTVSPHDGLWYTGSWKEVVDVFFIFTFFLMFSIKLREYQIAPLVNIISHKKNVF